MPLRKKCKKFLKFLLQSPLVLAVISTLLYVYARIIGRTTKWQTRGIEELYKIWEKEGSFIFIGWHGRALMIPHFWDKSHPVNALVSLHHDGRMIAGLLEKFGMGTIGGSSTENSKNAALELMRSLQRGVTIAIIPDGPKGPNMTLSRSAIYYAQKSGKPIMGATYSVKGSKIAEKSWDKMMLPKPFSEGCFFVSEPFYIPAHATETELEEYRKLVENRLNQLTWEADKAMNIKHIEPGSVARKRYAPPSSGKH